MGKGRPRFKHLNLLQRMMLWFTCLILAVFGCALIFLNQRITADMQSLVQTELNLTKTLFENVHKMRGEDLSNQCRYLASHPKLLDAMERRSLAGVRDVVKDYSATLGASAILVLGPNRMPLVRWWHPDIRAAQSDLASSIELAFAGESPPGMDVSAKGIYQTAWSPVRHRRTHLQLGTLIIGTPIDDRLAQRLRSMSGAEITFFPTPPDDESPSSKALPPRIVASTLTEDARQALTLALLDMDYDPRDVKPEGVASPRFVDIGEETPYLAVTAPIRGWGREVIGAYIIMRPLGEEARVVARVQRTLLWVLVAAVLAAVGISYAVSSGVARRILRVVRAAEGLSTGDWSYRVPEEGPEEVRILAEAFNQMANRLKGWDSDLRAEVALRTEELNQALARLDSNLRQMRQFHADASHELRTPLTIMRGEVEVALRTPRPLEEYQRVLNSILEEMSRVGSIVEHLLLLARADSGQIQVERAPVEVNGVLEDLHPQALLLAGPKGITVQLDEDRWVMVVGDSGKLRQLFLNLIDNAIKYTPEGGRVSLRVSSDDGFAVVSVSDTGIGIAQEDIPHIFDRFYRVDRARSREMGGTGLGLAICQWIIDAHHGWIDVQSAPGSGSTFTVHIPRVFEEAVEPADPEDLPLEPEESLADGLV